jgi:hypothetical protein
VAVGARPGRLLDRVPPWRRRSLSERYG